MEEKWSFLASRGFEFDLGETEIILGGCLKKLNG